MTNEIIYLKGEIYKTLKLNQHNFWFSEKSHRDVDAMQKRIEKRKDDFRSKDGIIPYNSITKIQMNENYETLKFEYRNQDGKDKKLKVKFENAKQATYVGQAIGEHTNLQKTVETENTNKALLKTGFMVLLSILGTALFAFYDAGDSEASGYSRSARRQRSGQAITKFIDETIGQTGVLIIGTLITAYFIYDAWKRYKNPVNDIRYE